MNPSVLKIDNIDCAMSELSKIHSNPVGVKIMALKAIHKVVKFEAVDPKAANIVKQEMLSRGGDAAVSESVAKFDLKNTDVILMGTLYQYIRLIRKLRKQNYEGSICAEIAESLRQLLFPNVDLDSAFVW